jgi:protein-tyrosine kinase
MTKSARRAQRHEPESLRPAGPRPTPGPSVGPLGMDPHLVGLLAPTSFDAESYRILANALERIRSGRPSLVVAVTSAAPGDGKTTTAINLAASLARRPECRVLLVDADLRRPAVAKALALPDDAGPTLRHFLQEPGGGLAKPATPWMPLALSVLPAGGVSALAHETLVSEEFSVLVHEARQTYRYVILDTPPAVALPDARAISGLVDGFVIVVRAGATPRRLVAEALEALEPQKVVGLVFNGDERPHGGYYGRYRSYYAAAVHPHGRAE